jgi:hypothetical protein
VKVKLAPFPGTEHFKRAAVDEEKRLVREAYLRTVSRTPTEQEEARAQHYLEESENVAVGLKDLLWALVNSDEFIVNH